MSSAAGVVDPPADAAARADAADLAVVSRGLTKRFSRDPQRPPAVAGVDLAVPRGAVFGFLGPNGSGKTTTIRMLLGLARASAGSHALLGVAMPDGAARVLPRVGALVEGPGFHPYLSGRSNLARLDAADASADPRTARTRIAEALERVGLAAAATKKYRVYSLGMRQRLGIAAALLQPRELLILDEPTNGLDPQGTREVRSLVASLAGAGTTVVLSTHLLAEVEQVCTHAAVMHRGRLLAQGALSELQDGSGAATTRVEVTSREAAAAARVLVAAGLADVTPTPHGARALLGVAQPERLVTALVEAGVPVAGFSVHRPSLEDAFVALTGEGFDVGG